MKKLYLHIGLLKTGTSSIQKALSESTTLLASNGLTYFTGDFLNNQKVKKGALNICKFSPENFMNEGVRIVQKDRFANHLAGIQGNVVTSSSMFSLVLDIKEIEDLKLSLSTFFDDIKIIIYLRRQDKFAISFKQQGSKGYNGVAALLFGQDPTIALPQYNQIMDNYLDYYSLVTRWSNVFGKENMIIRNFDELYENDAVADFFNLLGIEFIDHSFQNQNFSRGFKATKVGYLLNSLGITSNNHIRNNLTRNLSLKDDTKMLPSKDKALSFYEHYRSSNALLNQEFSLSKENVSIFNDDFSSYPVTEGDKWDENTVNEAISNIVESISETYGTLDINTLFNAAVKLENIDQTLSLTLMRFLNNIMPNNKNIQQKISQYTSNHPF